MCNSGNPKEPLPFQPLANLVSLLFGRLVPIFFFAGGVLILGFSIVQVTRGMNSNDWPATEGTIIDSSVKSVRRSRSGRVSDTSYHVHVRYSYSVAGVEFEGNRLAFGTTSHDDRSDAESQKREYPPGKRVEVFYDSNDHASAILIKGVGTGLWIGVTLGAILTVLGLTMCIVLPRIMSKRLNRADLGRMLSDD